MDLNLRAQAVWPPRHTTSGPALAGRNLASPPTSHRLPLIAAQFQSGLSTPLDSRGSQRAGPTDPQAPASTPEQSQQTDVMIVDSA
eukprot:1442594-Rhodomonas_salina.1